MVNRKTNWKNPYGKPNSAEKTITILQKLEQEIKKPKVWWDHPKVTKNHSISQFIGKWKNPLFPDETSSS